MKIDFAKFHTKQLLSILDSARAYRSRLFNYGEMNEDDYLAFKISPVFFGYDKYEPPYESVSFEELKAELATRPHIPNKVEAKKIRQEKAKKGR